MTKLIKNRDGNFTHVKNDIFESGLSAKAMGLFCYLWHLPDDWQFYEDEIVKHFQDGKTSIRTGIQELENAGFIERKQQRDSKGLFSKYDWVLHEKPILDNRKSENPKSQKRKSDNETLQSTNSTKYSIKQSTDTTNLLSGKPDDTHSADYKSIVGYLNERAGTAYKPTSKKTQALIRARMNEGFKVDDFKQAIDTKVDDWLNDPNMNKYLRPETLFSPKFEGYLNESRLKPREEDIEDGESW